MKRLCVPILLCIVLVGCRNNDYVTREEVNEIVEQSISDIESDDVSIDSETLNSLEPEYKIPVGLSNLDYGDFMSTELVDSIGNYETLDIIPDEDCFIFTITSHNKTDKTIKHLKVLFQSETSQEYGVVENIAPGEKMIFEFIMTSSDDIIYSSVEEIEYEEE